jgi:hypothetical protein
MPILTSELCREGRTLLDMEPFELAFAARVPLGTVLALETQGDGDVPERALLALRRVLERAGIEFTAKAGRRGVWLR